MKTKIIKSTIIIAILGIALWSCKKDEVSTQNIQEKNATTPFVKIKGEKDGKSFDLSINSKDDHLIHGELFGTTFRNISLDNTITSEIKSLNKINSNSYNRSTNSTIKELSFDNYSKIDEDEFNVDINVNGESVTVNFNTNRFSMEDFQNAANELTSASRLPILGSLAIMAGIAAVTWIADASLEYCQTVITQGTQNCSANNLCADIGWCSVTCRPC